MSVKSRLEGPSSATLHDIASSRFFIYRAKARAAAAAPTKPATLVGAALALEEVVEAAAPVLLAPDEAAVVVLPAPAEVAEPVAAEPDEAAVDEAVAADLQVTAEGRSTLKALQSLLARAMVSALPLSSQTGSRQQAMSSMNFSLLQTHL